MTSIHLDDQQWQQVLAILSTAPWRDANPLIMAIGEQLRGAGQRTAPAASQARAEGNGQEAHHE